MTKYPYTALLIPDAGHSVTLRQPYASAVTALATGRAEAKLIFSKRAEVQTVGVAGTGISAESHICRVHQPKTCATSAPHGG